MLAVEQGDLTSPAPALLQKTMPQLASAVDTLFAEVRSSIDNAHALGMYDPVTSLPNRLHFRSEVDKMLAAADRSVTSAMLFVDLDRFKAVNDSLGHARGDQLLVMVANRLRTLVAAEVGEKNTDRPLLARLAGDEFTIFFPNVNQAADAERVARRIAGAISEPFEIQGHEVDIGASVGVAIHPDHGTGIEDLMRAADLAMYEAKKQGGGRFCRFTNDLATAYRRRVETERALGEAILRDEFLMVFQPQLSLSTGQVCGAETLLRWNHPTNGLTMPSEFIGIAEQTGLMNEIGDWVVGEIAHILAAWKAEGIDQRLAFNISPRQLDRHDFFARMRHTLASADVDMKQVELEFTETAAMRVSDELLSELAMLRAMGAKITIDDFGSGYSNIARLRSMPLDRVKLDQSLIADIEHSEKARESVQAVMQLIKSVNAEVVAEAVETVAQADILRAMGCDTVQGFVFAQPMLEEDFLSWISNANRPGRSAA
nr:EAL domain-containing protein [uncultured Sphingomonas sp.]